MRAVAVQFGVSLATVQRWVAHAGNTRLDRVDWSGTRGGRREAQATPNTTEERVMECAENSASGAIWGSLERLPSIEN